MCDSSRHSDEGSGSGSYGLFVEFELDFSFQHVERLLHPLMNMGRRLEPWRECRLDDLVFPCGLVRADLDRDSAVTNRKSLAVVRRD